jgi:hypothetical protein
MYLQVPASLIQETRLKRDYIIIYRKVYTGYSRENDYESFFENITTEWYFNKKNTVLYVGAGYAYNITNVTAGSLGKGISNTESLFLGIKQDINKDFYIQQNAEVIFDNGFLSDWYKNITFNGADDAAQALIGQGRLNVDPMFLLGMMYVRTAALQGLLSRILFTTLPILILPFTLIIVMLQILGIFTPIRLNLPIINHSLRVGKFLLK